MQSRIKLATIIGVLALVLASLAAGPATRASAQVYTATPDVSSAIILAGVGPGGTTSADLAGTVVSVVCPSGCVTGQVVDLSAATLQYAANAYPTYTLPAVGYSTPFSNSFGYGYGLSAPIYAPSYAGFGGCVLSCFGGIPFAGGFGHDHGHDHDPCTPVPPHTHCH